MFRMADGEHRTRPGSDDALGDTAHQQVCHGYASSVFRTETRVAPTDRVARAKFRTDWSFVSPGIVLIRRLMLKPLKAEAERRRGAAMGHI